MEKGRKKKTISVSLRARGKDSRALTGEKKKSRREHYERGRGNARTLTHGREDYDPLSFAREKERRGKKATSLSPGAEGEARVFRKKKHRGEDPGRIFFREVARKGAGEINYLDGKRERRGKEYTKKSCFSNPKL